MSYIKTKSLTYKRNAKEQKHYDMVHRCQNISIIIDKDRLDKMNPLQKVMFRLYKKVGSKPMHILKQRLKLRDIRNTINK